MKHCRFILGCIALVCSLSVQLLGQSAFPEGILTYEADTSGQLGLMVSHIIVYKKADLVRIEVLRPHRSHPPDSEKLIFIQNKKGRYYYGIGPRSSELPDSIAHTALFISNHHQKSLDAETKAIDPNNYYRIDQQLGSTTWLDLPAERVILAGIPEHKPHEAIVTTAFPNLLGYYFTSLKKLPSMPLRFTFYEYGRFTDLTATSLKLQKVPDHLFELEPGYTTMTMFQMLEDISKMN